MAQRAAATSIAAEWDRAVDASLREVGVPVAAPSERPFFESRTQKRP